MFEKKCCFRETPHRMTNDFCSRYQDPINHWWQRTTKQQAQRIFNQRTRQWRNGTKQLQLPRQERAPLSSPLSKNNFNGVSQGRFHIKCPDLMARLALLRIWNKLNLSVAAKCSWKDWLTSICLLHPFHCMEMSQSVKSLLASMLLQLFPTCSKTCKKKQLTGERKLRESWDQHKLTDTKRGPWAWAGQRSS